MISSADFSARIRDNANIPEDAALFGETADCDNWHPSCRVGFGPRKLPKLFSLPLTQHSQSSRCPIRCQLFLFGSQIQTLNCLHQCKHEAPEGRKSCGNVKSRELSRLDQPCRVRHAWALLGLRVCCFSETGRTGSKGFE